MSEDPTRDSPPEPNPGAASRPSLFAELKRRKVFRVVATYALVSWLIIQVAAATFDNFGIPTWAFRFVVLMVLLGFPVAVVLAWALELTPEGVKVTRSARQDTAEPASPHLDRRRNWLAIGMAAALPTLIFGTLSIIFYLGKAAPAEASAPAARVSEERPYVIGSIAVLPLKIIPGAADLEGTAEGLHEEILTTLSEMSPLDVISRTSTLGYGGFDRAIPEIGADLRADYIVEGSLQEVGSRIRLTLQLIVAQTDTHLWAQTFDRSPKEGEDLLVFQKEVGFELALRIYQALEKLNPPEGESQRLRAARLATLEERLTREYAAFWTGYSVPAWRSLVATIETLLALDPDHADAYDKYAGILFASTDTGVHEFYDRAWRQRFHLALKRAWLVHPDGFDVNKHLAKYYHLYENQPGAAIPYARRAIEIEEARLGKAHPPTYSTLLEPLYANGQAAAALRTVETALARHPTVFADQPTLLSTAYEKNRKPAQALAILDELIRSFGDQPVNAFSIAAIWARETLDSRWQGHLGPIRAFAAQYGDHPETPFWIRVGIHSLLGEYEAFGNLIAEAQPSASSWQDTSNAALAAIRGFAYLGSGNEALARSYIRGYLNEMENSPQGTFMKAFSPDPYAAGNAVAYAGLGQREEARRWIRQALEEADPARHFGDYSATLQLLISASSLLGEIEEACGFIDQLLSSPSGFYTGDFLIDVRFTDLHEAPAFVAVMRKHADQLKDPAILETYFGAP